MNHHQAHPNKYQTALTEKRHAILLAAENLFFALFGIEIPAFFAIPDFSQVLQNTTSYKPLTI